MLESKHLTFPSAAEILTFLGTRTPLLPTHIFYCKWLQLGNVAFSGSTVRMLLPLFYTQASTASQGAMPQGETLGRAMPGGQQGDCPCASPCSPSGRCPWVSHPCSSQPRVSAACGSCSVGVRGCFPRSCVRWRRRSASSAGSSRSHLCG